MGTDVGHGLSISPGLAIEAEGPRLTNASTSGDTTLGSSPPTTGQQHNAKRPGHGQAEQSVYTGGRVHPSVSKQVHEVAVGKTCLPTTAKPHSGETTVESSSGTRRTSDSVETGLRHAHTRTKARATQTGREVPGLPERRRDRQMPGWSGRESPTARLLAHQECASIPEGGMDTGTFTGWRPRGQSQGRSGRHPGRKL